MKFIQRIEKSIKNIVEGSILGKFKGEIHPLELSKKIFEASKDGASTTQTKKIAPNYFIIKLSTHDYKLIEKAGRELIPQLQAYVEERAREDKIIFIDKIKIVIESDKKCRRGECLIETNFAIRQARAGFASIEKFINIFEVLFVFSGFEVDKIFPLLKDENTLGRTSTCDLFISDPNISRCHAKIIKKKCWLIEDQDSKNGTFVNGERVTMRMLND
ncbi:MAG: FhaA domain-containing protein, partial [Armatimonadota bacterium]